MAKKKTTFICQNCAYNSPKYLGRCPNCGAWSSFIEEVEVAEVKNARVSLTGQQGTKMKIIFVRHGEPDYRVLEERAYSGFGMDLAPLSEKGRKQAQDLCQNPLFQSADLLVASAVTRALETASYLACATGLPLKVEPLLHEWQVYESGIENFETARTLFLANNGKLLPDSPIQYETAEDMRARFIETLAKYRDYQKLVVVTHRMLMRQFVPNETIDFCQVIECEIEI